MMDAINEVIDLLNDRSESEGNSRSESSSISSKQNDSSYKCLENEEESKSIITKNDSNHTIRPSTTNRNSDFDSKSECQLACPSLILEEIKEPCFSYKKNEKERENPHSPKEESREEVDESSENYVDQYFRRLQGENLKKNLDESQSQDDKKFEQSQLERDLNNLSISTSQKVCDTDDKSEYLQKLDYILDNNGSNKLTEKLNEMTVKHQVSKIKGIDYENFEVNKVKKSGLLPQQIEEIRNRLNDDGLQYQIKEYKSFTEFRVNSTSAVPSIPETDDQNLLFQLQEKQDERLWIRIMIYTSNLKSGYYLGYNNKHIPI